MCVVGSSGWYAALAVLSTAPARTGSRIGRLWGASRRRCAGVGSEHRWLAGDEQITEGAPVEAFTAATHEFHEARRSGLGICERVMWFAVHHAQLAAQS